MGTRNLTAVRSDKVIKVAQYGQWDGYPTGQGDTIAVFLRTADEERFKSIVNTLKWYTVEEAKQIWKDAGADDTGWVTSDISAIVRNEHPELSRDTGADILQLIYDGKIEKLNNEFEFIKDSLYCEFAYIVDLDKRVVEIYADNYTPLEDVGDYKPLEDVPAPAKVMSFEDFKAEGAMEQLEKDLNPEDAENE